jgi:hypothetical protein
MFESTAMEETGALTGELSKTSIEREAMLAALAATLVEYRRRVASETIHGGAPGTGGNWRNLARWEQLQG